MRPKLSAAAALLSGFEDWVSALPQDGDTSHPNNEMIVQLRVGQQKTTHGDGQTLVVLNILVALCESASQRLEDLQSARFSSLIILEAIFEHSHAGPLPHILLGQSRWRSLYSELNVMRDNGGPTIVLTSFSYNVDNSTDRGDHKIMRIGFDGHNSLGACVPLFSWV